MLQFSREILFKVVNWSIFVICVCVKHICPFRIQTACVLLKKKPVNNSPIYIVLNTIQYYFGRPQLALHVYTFSGFVVGGGGCSTASPGRLLEKAKSTISNKYSPMDAIFSPHCFHVGVCQVFRSFQRDIFSDIISLTVSYATLILMSILNVPTISSFF